jgi:hypothetical protein
VVRRPPFGACEKGRRFPRPEGSSQAPCSLAHARVTLDHVRSPDLLDDLRRHFGLCRYRDGEKGFSPSPRVMGMAFYRRVRAGKIIRDAFVYMLALLGLRRTTFTLGK